MVKQSTAKKRKCSRKISECAHGHAGMHTGFGEVRSLSGEVVYKNADPSWQCTCCGFPMQSTQDKHGKA